MRKLSCDICGITPREVFPRNPGVNIDLRPGTERRPRRGASAPVVLRRVNSSISGGSLSSLGAVVSSDMATVSKRYLVCSTWYVLLCKWHFVSKLSCSTWLWTLCRSNVNQNLMLSSQQLTSEFETCLCAHVTTRQDGDSIQVES